MDAQNAAVARIPEDIRTVVRSKRLNEINPYLQNNGFPDIQIGSDSLFTTKAALVAAFDRNPVAVSSFGGGAAAAGGSGFPIFTGIPGPGASSGGAAAVGGSGFPPGSFGGAAAAGGSGFSPGYSSTRHPYAIRALPPGGLGAFGLPPATDAGAGGGGGGGGGGGSGVPAAPQTLAGFGMPDVPLIAAAAVAPVPVSSGTGSTTLINDEQLALVTAIDSHLASPAGRLAVGLIDGTFRISDIVAFSRAIAPVAKSAYTAAKGAYTKTSFYTALLTRWVAEKLEKKDETIMSTIASSSGNIRKLGYYTYDHAGLHAIIKSKIADSALKNLALKALNAGKEAHVATYNMIRSYTLLKQKYGIVGATQQSKNILTALTEAGSTTVEECNLLRDFFMYVYTVRVKQQLRDAFYAEYTSNPQVYDMILQDSERGRFINALDSILSMAGVKVFNPRPVDPSRSASVTEGGSKPIIRITAREQMSVNAIIASILEDTDTACTSIPGVDDLKALIRTILIINEGAVPVINPEHLEAATTLYSQIKSSYVRSTGNAGMFGMRGPNIGAEGALTGVNREAAAKAAEMAANAAVLGSSSGYGYNATSLAGRFVGSAAALAARVPFAPVNAARYAANRASGAVSGVTGRFSSGIEEGWGGSGGPSAISRGRTLVRSAITSLSELRERAGPLLDSIKNAIRRTGNITVRAGDNLLDLALLLVVMSELGAINITRIYNQRVLPKIADARRYISELTPVAKAEIQRVYGEMMGADVQAAGNLVNDIITGLRLDRDASREPELDNYLNPEEQRYGGRGGARRTRRRIRRIKLRNRKTHKHRSTHKHKIRRARFTRKTSFANRR